MISKDGIEELARHGVRYPWSAYDALVAIRELEAERDRWKEHALRADRQACNLKRKLYELEKSR